MKIALATAVAALAVLCGSAHAPAAKYSGGTAAGIFVVRPDPRACPSPLCGGYWVSLANHARTRCSDGLLRPRCYVAYVLDSKTTDELSPVSGSLAKGELGFQESPDFGRLGQLTVGAVWAPVSQKPAAGGFFRLRDTGIRCVRAPCFSMRAMRINAKPRVVQVSAVDLGPATGRRVNPALRSTDGLLVAGGFEPTGNGGRLFRVTQAYLRASRPRA